MGSMQLELLITIISCTRHVCAGNFVSDVGDRSHSASVDSYCRFLLQISKGSSQKWTGEVHNEVDRSDHLEEGREMMGNYYFQ